MKLLATNARNLSEKPKRSALNKEIGVGGVDKKYFSSDRIDQKPTTEELNQMINTDGTARSLYSLLQLPIMSNSWRIDPDSDDVEGTDEDPTHPQADLVESNFILPPHKGGMSTPFRLVLKHMVRAILEGHAGFEKVLTISEDGKYVYKKIAPRAIGTISIQTDDNGGFAGFKQKTFINNKFIDVFIPVEKCFLFTVNKDVDPLEGDSYLRTAYYHYDKKHRLYFLYENAVEKGSMAPKILKIEEGNSDSEAVQDANLTAVEEFGINSTVKVPQGYDLSPYDTKKGQVDAIPGIDHHNAEMARSALAQFILLGTQNDSSGGSYALSESHTDLLLMSIKGIMNEIEEHINAYLIPQLHEWNFDKPLYSEFRFNDMTDDTREFLEKIFIEVIQRIPQGLSEEFVENIQKQIAERLDLDVTDFTPGNLGTGVGGAGDPVTPVKENSSRVQKKKSLAESERWRETTEAESSVSLDQIESKFNTIEDQFIEEMRPVFTKTTDKAIEDLREILKSGELDKLEELKLQNYNEYRNVIIDNMTEMYNFGKMSASDELEVKAPKTPKEARDFIKLKADEITNKQYEDILFLIRSTVTKEVQKGNLSEKNLDEADILGALIPDIEAFFEDKIGLTATAITSQAINKARDDVFGIHASEIAVYQYSAILDDRVCPICEALDGTVLDDNGYRNTRFVPPIHFYCRCIWIAIKKDQTEIPEITEEPDAPGGITEPLLSDEKAHHKFLHKHFDSQ